MQKAMMILALVLGIAAGTVAQAQEAAPAPVAMQDVESTLLKSVGYDAVTQVLTVVFVTSDEVYEYYEVPAEVFAALMAAESKGSYFSENIKNKYRFEKKP